MKIKKYTNSAWADLDKPVKKFATYTDEATTLPLTIQTSKTDAVENYQVYGAAEGAGVETENLVTEIIQNATINSAGTLVTSSTYNVSIAPITAGTTYTLLRDYNITMGTTHYAFFANLPAKGSTSYDGNRNSTEQVNVTITAPITGYVVVLNKEGKSTVAEGNTAIPYGYKIPLTVESGEQSGTYPLYIGDSKLGEDEYVDFEVGKVYKRTANFYNKNATDESKGYIPGYYIRYNGVTLSESAYWCVSEYFKLPANAEYIYIVVSDHDYSANNPAICFYDQDKEFVSGVRYVAQKEMSVEVPATAVYVRMSVQVPDAAMLVEGSAAPETYIPYLRPVDPPAPFPTLTTYIDENNIDVDTTTAPDKVVLEYKGWKGIGEPQIYDSGEWKDEPSEDINLIYQLDNAYWSDGYVKSDGTIAQSSSFKYNEHFAISPSTEYVLAYETNSPDCSVSWYTENKTFIQTDEITNKRVCFYTSPSNAKYAILSVPTGSPYILFAKKSDVNSLPQITDPIDGTNWKQGWIKSDGTINTDSDYAYYDGAIDVSDCSKVFVGHSGLLVSSKYLELYEMDSNDQKTVYKDEEYIDGTYKEFNLNVSTTKLRFSTSRCTDVMIIKSRVYYKT